MAHSVWHNWKEILERENKGRKFRQNIQEGAAFTVNRLQEMSQENNARGAMMRYVAGGAKNVGEGYQWLTEPLKYAAEEGDRIAPGIPTGKAFLGQLLLSTESLAQTLHERSGRGAEMLATGEELYNPITKERIGQLPDLGIDPPLAKGIAQGVTGITSEILLEKGLGKGLKALDKASNLIPPKSPGLVPVLADGSTTVTRNADEFVPSSTFQYSGELTTGPGGKPRYKTPVAKLDDRPLSRQGSKTVGSTEQISNRHLSELELKQGRAMYGYQRTVLGGSPHHFALDLELSGNALNRVDDAQIVKALAQNHNIRPGNVKSNFIMAYHDKSTKMRLAYQLEIKRLRELKGLPPLDQRVLDDLTKTVDPKFKNITVGKHKFKIEITDGGLPKTKTYNPEEYYSRFRKIAGIDPKDIRIDPRNTVLGRDHIEIIHAANDALPERQALMELVKSEKWRTIPPKEAADRLAEVADLQSNIAINVSKWRYQQIKRYINKNIAQGDIHNWTPKRIQKWMIDNPHLSANIGWYPRKGELPPTLAKLRQPPKGNWKEVAEVFGLEFDIASQSKVDELMNFFNTPGKPWKTR